MSRVLTSATAESSLRATARRARVPKQRVHSLPLYLNVAGSTCCLVLCCYRLCFAQLLALRSVASICEEVTTLFVGISSSCE